MKGRDGLRSVLKERNRGESGVCCGPNGILYSHGTIKATCPTICYHTTIYHTTTHRTTPSRRSNANMDLQKSFSKLKKKLKGKHKTGESVGSTDSLPRPSDGSRVPSTDWSQHTDVLRSVSAHRSEGDQGGEPGGM